MQKKCYSQAEVKTFFSKSGRNRKILAKEKKSNRLQWKYEGVTWKEKANGKQTDERQ